MVKARVTSKGQVTIPKDIRKFAMIKSGTELDFQVQKDGKIVITPMQKNISTLKGMIKSKNKQPVSLSEMKRAIAAGAIE